jgi:hypothetical protein
MQVSTICVQPVMGKLIINGAVGGISVEKRKKELGENLPQ